MTVERSFKLLCDFGPCHDMHRFEVLTMREARKQARRVGWTTQRVQQWDGTSVTKDYCPRHRPLPK